MPLKLQNTKLHKRHELNKLLFSVISGFSAFVAEKDFSVWNQICIPEKVDGITIPCDCLLFQTNPSSSVYFFLLLPEAMNLLYLYE